jgi:hypothetical protein
MKQIMTLLFVSMGFGCFSQNMTFNQQGKVTGTKKFANAPNAPALAFKLTVEQKKDIKKDLILKFRNALDNLQDEKYNLKDIYDHIWGPGVTGKIIADYAGFLSYLEDDNGTAASHDAAVANGFILKPSEFEAQVFNVAIYTEKDDNSGKEYDVRQLIFTNPYRHFIIDHLQKTMTADAIDKQLMDIHYKKAWRILEESYTNAEKALSEIREALKPCVPTACKDYKPLITDLKNLLENNLTLVQKLLKKDFFKKWLWYNEGFLFMNPVNATTKDRLYPIGEKISKLGDSAKNIVLADSNHIKVLAELLTTMRIKNEVLVSKTTTVDRYHYDASQNYLYLNKNALPKSRDNKKGVAVVVYNVPAKEKLTFDWNKSKNIPDAGSVSQSIADAGSSSSLTTILTGAAGWITAWGKVSQSLNPPPAQPTFMNVAPPKPIKVVPVVLANVMNNKSLMQDVFSGLNNANKSSDSNFRFLSPTISAAMTLENPGEFESIDEEKEEKLYVKINERFVLATRNSEVDKILFIKTYLIRPDTKQCNKCNGYVENCIIDSFIISDRCYALNYKNEGALIDGTNLLLERFECYTKAIDDCRKKLETFYEDIRKNYLPRLKAYVSVIQRSLPPVFTKDGSNYKDEIVSKDTADYRTEIFETSKDNLPDSAKKLVYAVTSSLPGKKNDGKEVSPNIVIQHSYRYSKRHWIDFSAGIAWSVKDYSIKKTDGPLPKVSEGDRFRPIAGMHIYPLGLLKIDDRLYPFQPSRLSVFLGLGITKALENFYPGISYDVVPGIRTIVGFHIYKDTKYTIANNAIIDQASSYKKSGIFLSLNMEPRAFASFIGLIK